MIVISLLEADLRFAYYEVTDAATIAYKKKGAGEVEGRRILRKSVSSHVTVNRARRCSDKFHPLHLSDEI